MTRQPPQSSSRRSVLVAGAAALLVAAMLTYMLTRGSDAGTTGTGVTDEATRTAPRMDDGAGAGTTNRTFDAAGLVARRSILTLVESASERCRAGRGDQLYSGGEGDGRADCLSPSELRAVEPGLARVDLRVGSAAAIRTAPRPAGSVWLFPLRDKSAGTPTSGLIAGHAAVLGIPIGSPPNARIVWFAFAHRPNGRIVRTCAIGGRVTVTGSLDGRGTPLAVACPKGRW